jgi:hypothetical protein
MVGGKGDGCAMGSGGFLTTIDLNGDGGRDLTPPNAIYLDEIALLSAVSVKCAEACYA